MKTLAIIGSTGSIGKSTLNVYKKNKNKFQLLCLATHSNLKKLKYQKKIFKPKSIFLLNNNINHKKLITKELFIKKYKKKKIDYVISGLSGFEAINFNFELLKISKNLLIANKETIICGGEIFINSAKKNNCKLLPIDSEHHCIDFFINNFKGKNLIKKYYITASGGPFYDKKNIYNQSIKNVLKHPTWKMGKKISIDSSNFANKVLELFEAKILFKLSNKEIDIRVEKSSNVHAIIELTNNLVFPIMHTAKMEIPISNALNLKNNFKLNFDDKMFSLLSPNKKKFPLINLGFKILSKYDHIGMIIFTVINEKLVKMFLKNEIKYGDIVKILINTFKNKKIFKFKSNIKDLNDINKAINYAKNIELCLKK